MTTPSDKDGGPKYPYADHDKGMVLDQPRPGEFTSTPMTPAQLAARDPALAIAKDIYRHANQAGACYYEFWLLISKAMQGAMDAAVPETQAHTDHPMRHFDRTCPACVAENNAAGQAQQEAPLGVVESSTGGRPKDRYESGSDSPAPAAPATPRTLVDRLRGNVSSPALDNLNGTKALHVEAAECIEQLERDLAFSEECRRTLQAEVMRLAAPVSASGPTVKESLTVRPCTCHPDDNPPRPCPQKYALTECREAAARSTSGPLTHKDQT